MKSDDSIKSITVAAIRRSSKKIASWTRTSIIDEFPLHIKPLDNELPVVYFKIDDRNWTLITTRRITGQIESFEREIYFEELDGVTWGHYKDSTKDKTIFRTCDNDGDRRDFCMETGFPSMAFVYGVQTIDHLTKSNMTGQT